MFRIYCATGRRESLMILREVSRVLSEPAADISSQHLRNQTKRYRYVFYYVKLLIGLFMQTNRFNSDVWF